MGKVVIILFACAWVHFTIAEKIQSPPADTEPKEAKISGDEINLSPFKTASDKNASLSADSSVRQRLNSHYETVRIILLENKVTALEANIAAVLKMLAKSSHCSSKEKCEKAIKSLENDLKELKKQLGKNKRKIKAVQGLIANHTDSTAVSEAALWRNISALDDQLAEKEGKISELEIKLSKQEAQVALVETFFRQNISELQKQLGEHKREIKAVKGLIANHADSTAVSEAALYRNISALDDQLAEKVGKISELEVKLSKQEAQVALVEAYFRQNISELLDIMRKGESRVTSLEANLATQSAKAAVVEAALKKNISALQSLLKEKESKITALGVRVTSGFGQRDKTIAELTANFTSQFGQNDRKFAELEASFVGRLAQSDKKLAALETRLSSSLQQKDNEIKDIKGKLTSLETRLASSEKWIVEQKGSTGVSFHAVQDSSQTVSSGSIVRFSRVIHNSAPTGYGYISGTSKFRCPISGVYAFFFHATTYACDATFQAAIKRDSTTLSSTYAYTSKSSAITYCRRVMTAAAVTQCQRGQYVYIASLFSSLKLYPGYNSFSGFKIY